MTLKDDHDRRVAAMPADVRKAHEHSMGHRDEIMRSKICGCFYCFATFPPNAIAEWVDEIKGVGQTALCPWCSIDSVMGDRSGYPITAAFLKSMNAFWF